MLPTQEERERAREHYMLLLKHDLPATNPIARMLGKRCVDVSLRLAHHVADAFGLPRFAENVDPLPGERARAWVDRIAGELANWRNGEGVQPSEERRLSNVHRVGG